MAADEEEKTPAALEVGQAVHFRFTDALFGTVYEQAGLVLAVSDDAVSVAPVAPVVLLVQAADVEPLTAPGSAE